MPIRRTLLSILLFVSILASVVSTVLLYRYERKSSTQEELTYLKETVEQLLIAVDTVERRVETLHELFTADFVNRANTAAILYDRHRYGTADHESEGLTVEEIAETIEVLDVNIVDGDGIVVESSDPLNIGFDFHQYENLREYLPLIAGQSNQEYVVQLDAHSLVTGSRKAYVGVPMRDGSPGMVQIEIDPHSLEEYESVLDVRTALESIPTEWHRILFAVDQETGEVLAWSRNNPQYQSYSMAEFPALSEGEMISRTFQSQTNGKPWAGVFTCYHGNVYGYVSDLTILYEEVNRNTATLIMSVWLLHLVMLALLYRLLGRFMLKDMAQLDERLEEFTEGYPVCFSGGRSREFKELNRKISLMAESIESRSARISTMARVLGKDFAVYEYFPGIKQEIYSDNLLDMMEITREEAHERAMEKFQAVDPEQVDPQNGYYAEESFITKSGRHLLIRRTVLKSSSYAFVQDVTENEERVKELKGKLKTTEDKSNRDFLTGLYNRKFVQTTVEEYLKSEPVEGVMLLLDMDNFKKVNDSMGHQEGDLLLKKFSRILERFFRPSDIVARLGGDEFVVLLQSNIPEDTLQQKINAMIDAMHRELAQYYVQHRLSVSIGVVRITPEVDSFDQLYQYADAAMYVAKRSGKDGFYFNRENNPCMKQSCVHCRAVCDRRKALFGGEPQ